MVARVVLVVKHCQRLTSQDDVGRASTTLHNIDSTQRETTIDETCGERSLVTFLGIFPSHHVVIMTRMCHKSRPSQ